MWLGAWGNDTIMGRYNWFQRLIESMKGPPTAFPQLMPAFG
jgi:hypothetical protein